VKFAALVLLLGGAGLSIVSIVLLVVSLVATGGLDDPTAQVPAPVTALVLLGTGGAAVVAGFALAVVLRLTRR
jgi:hypothetical protein